MDNFISLSEETANKLLHMIVVEKKFASGERLPNESELCMMLSVSRTPLREAVKILISRGLLEIKRGVGTFVANDSSLNSCAFLNLCSEESKQRALEALYIRLILEPNMIKSAITSATEQEKQLIYKYEKSCRLLIEANKDYTYEDHWFHKCIASASHNATYEKLLPILHSSITIILKSQNFTKTSAKSANNALIYHKKIVDAMKSGDIKGAELASKMHIYNSIQYLNEYP